MNPSVRITGCRLIEKMKTDPAYADQLSLRNMSAFCPESTQASRMAREEKENRKKREKK